MGSGGPQIRDNHHKQTENHPILQDFVSGPLPKKEMWHKVATARGGGHSSHFKDQGDYPLSQLKGARGPKLSADTSPQNVFFTFTKLHKPVSF